jgi:S1-C subfamily serine protease
MNLRYTLVASLLLFCGTSQAQLSAEQCQRSVCCVVQTTWFNMACGTGTGFFISKERVLTAAHVAEGARYIMLPDGTKHSCYVEKKGPLLDWAILRVPGANGLPLKLAKSSTKGEPVWCYGSFEFDGDGLQVTVGNVWACREDGYHTATAPVYPGYSGGCVVDNTGKVLGVTSKRAANYGNACIYVPIQSVKRAAGL